MKFRLFLRVQFLLFWMIIIHGSLAMATVADSTSVEVQNPKDVNLEMEIDKYLKPYMDLGSFSGVIFIAMDGKVLLNKGYGMANYELNVPNTPTTKFHIASVSKPFTAIAILKLQEQNLLKVIDPLTKFIPDYPAGDKISIHHLLTHTSGIPNVNSFPEYDKQSKLQQTTADLVAMFKDKPLQFEPGERFSYSNSNYNLLAYIIEGVSGKTYGDFLQEHIFDPAGMQNTGHDGDPQALIENRASGYVPVGINDFGNAPYINWSVKTGNGSLYSTVGDLYKLDRALYTETLLGKVSVQQMFTEHISGVGYGWFVNKRFGRRVTRINGRSPGFNCEIQRYVDDDMFIAVLANNYAATASLIINDIAAILFGEPYEPPPVVEPVKLNISELDRLIGKYQFGEDFYVPNAVYTIEREKDYLIIEKGDWSAALVPQSKASFFLRDFWSGIRFVPDESGEIVQMIWEYGEAEMSANKIQ